MWPSMQRHWLLLLQGYLRQWDVPGDPQHLDVRALHALYLGEKTPVINGLGLVLSPDRLSCTLGWPHVHHVAQDDLDDLFVSCLHIPNAGIIGSDHYSGLAGAGEGRQGFVCAG